MAPAPAFTPADLLRIVRTIKCHYKNPRTGGCQYLWYSQLSRGWLRATSELDKQVRRHVLLNLPHN